MVKNPIFRFHVLIDGSVALWGGAARQKSCSPGLSSNYGQSKKKQIFDLGLPYIYLRNPQNRDFLSYFLRKMSNFRNQFMAPMAG